MEILKARVGSGRALLASLFRLPRLWDVDCFKDFNDTYGHLVGDACLRSVARVACEVACRPADLVARYGGDEFTVVLPATSMADAEELAGEEICTVCCGSCRFLTTRIVGEVARRDGELRSFTRHMAVDPQTNTCEDLLLVADSALYKMKERGRNGVASARLPSAPGPVLAFRKSTDLIPMR